jgi:hypothetical protein
MVKLTKKILLEALGVPEGILKSAESIYSKLIKFISEEGNNNIEDENYYFKLDGPFKINEYKIKSIELKLSFATADYVDEITLLGLALSSKVVLDDTTLTLISINSKDNLDMSINMVIPNTDIIFSDFYKYLKDNDKVIIASLSHELKHSYDLVKKPSGSIRDRSKYSAYTSLGFGINPID